MKSDSGLCKQFCSITGLFFWLMGLSSLAQTSSESLDSTFRRAFNDVKYRITMVSITTYRDSLEQKAIAVHLDSISKAEHKKILNQLDSIAPAQIRQDILMQLNDLGEKYPKLSLTSGLPFYEVIELKLRHEWLPDKIVSKKFMDEPWPMLLASFFIGVIVVPIYKRLKKMIIKEDTETQYKHIEVPLYHKLMAAIQKITGKQVDLTKTGKEGVEEALKHLENYQSNQPKDLLGAVKQASDSEQNRIKDYLDGKDRYKNSKDVSPLPESPPRPTPQDQPEARKENFYFGSAGVNSEGKAIFDSQDVKFKNADRVFYEFIVEYNNPEKAEVKLIEIFLDNNFSSFMDLTVERVCTIKNTRSTSHTKIRTVTPGKAEKIEGDWVVTEKVIVEYV